MYHYLHGMITMHTENAVVVECQGVGYECLVSHPEDFPIGESMFVFVCFFVHEDEQYLVGFKTKEEKDFFQRLTSVSGVGTKTAMNLLSNSSVERLSSAIDKSDQNYLMSMPGIGKKTASQIILDLKGKLVIPVTTRSFSEKNMELAFEGLKGLGFKVREIEEALNHIQERNLSVEDYMTRCLRLLNRNG